MGFIAVIAAAVASYVWGAIWYGVMAKPWMAAAGLSEETIGRRAPASYVIGFVATVLVAGMTRHIMASAGLDGVVGGLMTGAGLGLFVATPWIATNYAFAQRPMKLTVIDGAYATGGCTIIGVVLGLF